MKFESRLESEKQDYLFTDTQVKDSWNKWYTSSLKIFFFFQFCKF